MIVAEAFTHIAHAQPSDAQQGQTLSSVSRDVFVIPDLLNCLVLSWSEQRAEQLLLVARDETWQAKICGDVQEFLRSVFQLEVPLTIVDLPPRSDTNYAKARETATHTSGLNRSLLVICGAVGDHEEELWARQLGVWAYLPGAADVGELRHVFAEARKALAKQSTSYCEASGYR